MNLKWDALWIHGHLVTCDEDFSIIKDGAIAVADGKIIWIGATSELSQSPESLANQVYDLNHSLLTPGLIDCHTHTIFAGHRAREFEMRLNGLTYKEIALQGGGIQATVAATREATGDELYDLAKERLITMMQNGVTTVEIKSGYGLNWKTEQKILEVSARLAHDLPINIHSTFLGAHKVPEEYANYPHQYVEQICYEMLPAIKQENLAQSVDVFCENIAFDLEQTEAIFKCAQSLGFQIKCHSEQLSCSGSAQLAAHYKATSVDHLEFLSDEGVKAIAQSGTTAVLLPGAYYYLQETVKPPIEKLRAHKVRMAIASDFNPGTSPINSLRTIMNMASNLFGLTLKESLWGVTLNAAYALGMQTQCGSLSVGKLADMAVWAARDYQEIAYFIGNSMLRYYIKDGNVIDI